MKLTAQTFFSELLRTAALTGAWTVGAFVIVELVRPGTVSYFFPLHWLAFIVIGVVILDIVVNRKQ